MPRLLGPQQRSPLLQPLELPPILLTHSLSMHLANLTLHLRVHDAWPDRHGGHEGFFHGQGQRDVVKHGFSGTVGAPGLVGGERGAG